MLVIVKYRNIHPFFEFTLHGKTTGGTDIFQIYTAESGFQSFHCRHEFIHIGAVVFVFHLAQTDRHGVDIGKVFEQHRFALHHRQTGFSTDIAQTKHGGTVAYHCHEVAADSIFPHIGGIFFDFQTGLCHTGGVCQSQIGSGIAGLDRHHGNFSRPTAAVVFQSGRFFIHFFFPQSLPVSCF